VRILVLIDAEDVDAIAENDQIGTKLLDHFHDVEK
jgi:hypothetical protein